MTVNSPAASIASAASNTSRCAAPTFGSTAQPNDAPRASSSMALAALHFLYGLFSLTSVCSKEAVAFRNGTGFPSACTMTSVITKLPLPARPGPFFGSESSGITSIRNARIPV